MKLCVIAATVRKWEGQKFLWVIGEGQTEEFRVDAKTVVPIEASDKTLPEISWKSLGAWKVKILISTRLHQ